MSLFATLKEKIFGKAAEDEAPAEEDAAAEDAAAEEGEAGVVGEEGAAAPAAAEPAPAAEAAPAPAPAPAEEPAPAPVEEVDVEAMLDQMNANHPEDLDWRHSIVDLLKLVNMDSSYGARKELAKELGNDSYEGSAEDNIQLNKQVLAKLAENGGKVPSDL
ncbi:MAG: DUF3597 domain-containing protein, partial [Verrucomicrobiales bacterium]|nr:DUF3597 domain-containing protein [Verrucomicrobiales bacterium]